MLSDKCSCLKFNNKKCNNNYTIIINDSQYCLNHALLLYNKFVLVIQKYYRGYRCRRYLVNIFYNVPKELQEIIIYYINETHYHKTYLKSLTRIVNKNTFDLHNYRNSDNKLSIDYLYNCYKLYNKYHCVININYLKHSYILSHHILNFCDILLEQDQIVIPDAYSIFNKILQTDINEKKIYDLIDIIYKFSTLYSLKYSIYYNGNNQFIHLNV